MSPPPYTTISLHPLPTASTGLTFLYQRQCRRHHIPLFHCIHCIHWFDLFASKTMSPPSYTTIPLHTASTSYCVHWSPPPYTTMLLHPLRTTSTPSSHLCVILTQTDICDLATECPDMIILQLNIYIYNSPFKDSHLHPIHTCFPIIASNGFIKTIVVPTSLLVTPLINVDLINFAGIFSGDSGSVTE